jgi:hypothetical protein
MHIVKRNRRRAASAGPTDGERLAPGELAQFAGKLSGVVGRDERFAAVAITSNRVDGALEHEPCRRMALADIEHGLARREVTGRTTGKPLRRLDLPGIEHGKHLWPRVSMMLMATSPLPALL